MIAGVLVACGGALGAVARYGLSQFMRAHVSAYQFPWATFVVNVLGCLAAGILAALAERFEISPNIRILFFTGILGGFTTFSAFGLETVTLLKQGEWVIASLYVVLSVVVGCGALGAGLWLVKGGG